MASGFESESGSDRLITAFFDQRPKADEAAGRVAALGIARNAITIVEGSQADEAAPASETAGGFWETLRDLFLPDDDRSTYAEGLRRGGYVLSVRPSADLYERVIDILDDEGAVDLEARETAWRQEGWSGSFGGESTASDTISGASDRSLAGRTSDEEQRIPVVEDEMRIGKRDVSHGRVRVRSYFVEMPIAEAVDVSKERAGEASGTHRRTAVEINDERGTIKDTNRAGT